MKEHDDIRSLLGVYALDAIDDPDELRSVELHLAECAECRTEVDSHRSVTTAMAEAELTAPPGLWSRIEEDLDQTSTPPLRRWWSFQGITSIAAVAAIAAALGMTALWIDANGDVADLRERVGDLEATVDQAQLALEADPIDRAVEDARSIGGSLQVSLEGEIGTSTAIVLPDGQGWLTDISYQPLDHSQTYQLWAIQDGEVISAGVLGSAPETLSFHVDAALLEGLVITVEDAGGVVSSSQPAAAAWLAET